MIGRHEDRHENQDDLKPRSPVLWEESPDNVAERTVSDVTITTAAPFPVPWHLLEQLRNYPRMRDLVVGYLLVQERIARYEEIMSDLDAAGRSPDKPFWARLHRQLGSEGLRADFPNSLLGDQQFEQRINTFDAEHSVNIFDAEHSKARVAAMAGRNPHQSAQSAEVAYTAVSAMLSAAEDLANGCKAEGRRLLDKLYDTVNKIFADEEERPARRVETSERSTGASLAETPNRLAPTLRDAPEKQLQQGVSVPDVETHLLAKR